MVYVVNIMNWRKLKISPLQALSLELFCHIYPNFCFFSDFTISYLAVDSEGQSVYLTMLSDWDMDAAFQCAADPCLKLKVDLRPFEEGNKNEYSMYWINL